MNRAQRRQRQRGARQAQHHHAKRIIKPCLMDIHLVFEPIEAVFTQLHSGEIQCDEKGTPIFKDFEGNWYEISPAIDGWVELWETLFRKWGFALDITPLAKLSRKLAYGVLMTPLDVAAAHAVIAQCRQLFRQMDVNRLKSEVRTQQIRMEMVNR